MDITQRPSERVQAAAPRPLRGSMHSRRRWWGLIFVLPVVLFFLVFNVYPILNGVYLSMTSFTLLRPPVWIGTENYVELLHDPLFKQSVLVTLGFVAGSTIPVWILSLLAAVLFFQHFPARNLMKTIFYTPVLPSLVVISIIWKVLLHPNGILTHALRPLTGLPEIRWLNDFQLSPLSMILVNDWATIPFFMLIWLAGLMGIPNELREAALVDGATRRQAFFRIELPLLRPTALFIAAITTINAFQGFTLQWVMTPDRGGPLNVNTTLGLYIWQNGFVYYRMGIAAAASVILFGMILLVTAFQLSLGRSRHFSMD
jgi:multiple sugar transport system permease protein